MDNWYSRTSIVQGITIPALYSVSNENLILRTVLTTLQQEIFRRGYFWEKKFHKKCIQPVMLNFNMM